MAEAASTEDRKADAGQARASATITPSFEFYRPTEVPAICDAETVLALFEEFTRRYNAEDLDGVIALLQDELPVGHPARVPMALIPIDESGKVGFQVVSMDDDVGGRTHVEVRSLLEERFEMDERLRLKRVTIAPAPEVSTGPYPNTSISQRNAIVNVEFERWSADRAAHTAAGKSAIDCQASRIILLSFGG